MSKRKRRLSVKTKSRMFVIFMFFGAIIATLGFTFFRDLNKIRDLNYDMKKLVQKENDLIDEEAAIEADIKKLSDPSYIARYAREKYFYSKEGEIILRMK